MAHQISAQARLRAKNVVKLSGLSPRHLARLAARGDIPGAVRADGVHFEYADTEAFRQWLEAKRSERKRRKVELCALGQNHYGEASALCRRAQFALNRFISRCPADVLRTHLQEWLSTLERFVDIYELLEDRGNIPSGKRRVNKKPSQAREWAVRPQSWEEKMAGGGGKRTPNY